jgi:hypothetical protein
MESEGVHWHPRSVIEKYSADQVAWFRSRGIGHLTGDRLRTVFHTPENGVTRLEGNSLTTAGLDNLARLLAGQGGVPLSPGRMTFGVGSDAVTEFSREHVNLSNADGEAPGRSWYIPMDAGYPHVGAVTELHGQATFTETDACFEWKEWCWAVGAHKPASHHALLMAFGGDAPVMLNRKANPAGWGTKEIGVAWVFHSAVRLS